MRLLCMLLSEQFYTEDVNSNLFRKAPMADINGVICCLLWLSVSLRNKGKRKKYVKVYVRKVISCLLELETGWHISLNNNIGKTFLITASPVSDFY